MVYTAFRLSREAKHWWQAKKALLVMELGSKLAITWIIFKDEFNRHFFPRVVQDVKAREFMDIVQGRLSVIEYAARFLLLSRFAMYLIPDEKKRTSKFDRGQNTRIQTMLTCFDICNFSQLVDRASIYEESLKENAVEFAFHK